MGKFVLGPKHLRSSREPKAPTSVETKYITIERIVEVPVETIKEVERIVIQEVVREVEKIKEIPVDVIREIERIKEIPVEVEKIVEKLIHVEGPVQFVPRIVFREHMPKWAGIALALQALLILILLVVKK